MSKKLKDLEELITFSSQEDKQDAQAFSALMRRNVKLPDKQPGPPKIDVDQLFQEAFDEIDSREESSDSN